MPGRAVFLQAEGSINDHDLGLFAVGAQAGASGAGRSTVGLHHLAREVDTLAELVRIRGAPAEAGALTGASDHATTKALYARDHTGPGPGRGDRPPRRAHQGWRGRPDPGLRRCCP